MKANHNTLLFKLIIRLVVVNLTNWQNESKSQPYLCGMKIKEVVVNLTNWQNESKSQQGQTLPYPLAVVVNLTNWQNESKSQQSRETVCIRSCCSKSH